MPHNPKISESVSLYTSQIIFFLDNFCYYYLWGTNLHRWTGEVLHGISLLQGLVIFGVMFFRILQKTFMDLQFAEKGTARIVLLVAKICFCSCIRSYLLPKFWTVTPVCRCARSHPPAGSQQGWESELTSSGWGWWDKEAFHAFLHCKT